ncbi:MAG: PLDc N-terminal domain-containing protein [Selenomonadaceae bacterium]|nr:PLDc N-terminal domain-containing protein [Selenomonadaceae bacterium]
MNRILIHIFGTIIILGFGALLFVAALGSENDVVKKILELFFGGRAMPLIINSGLSIAFYVDALKRQIPYAWLWFLGMFVLPIIGIVIYLLKRPRYGTRI